MVECLSFLIPFPQFMRLLLHHHQSAQTLHHCSSVTSSSPLFFPTTKILTMKALDLSVSPVLKDT